jgi:hypothetical protein
MPDFDKLHDLSRKLAALTNPGDRQDGLATWCMFVGETWQEIVKMWDDPRPPVPQTLSELWDDYARQFPTRCMQDTTVGQLYAWARNRAHQQQKPCQNCGQPYGPDTHRCPA